MNRCRILTGTMVFLLAVGSAYGGGIRGTVKDQSGTLVSGALVKIKNLEHGVTTAVISQELGNYSATDLMPGRYTVQGIGGEFQSETAPFEVDESRTAELELVLAFPANIEKTASMNDFASLLPEGEEKEIILARCTECHHPKDLQTIISVRRTREGWQEILAKVADHSAERTTGFFFSDSMPRQQKDAVLDYLARWFGPAAPPLDLTKLPRRWVKGAAARAVVTEIDLPPGARPYPIAVDSNGIGWVVARFNDHTDDHGQPGQTGLADLRKEGAAHIGRFDPRTRSYSRSSLPVGSRPGAAFAVDPKGRLWIGDDAQARFIEYDASATKFNFYPYPASPIGGAGMNVIRFHPDGSVWGTALPSNRVLRLYPATRQVTEYRVPSGLAVKYHANPTGMAIDGNNDIWVAVDVMGKVSKINAKTGEIKDYDLRTNPFFLSSPRRMATDAAGNLWVAEYGAAALSMIDYHTGKITQFRTPTKNSGPYGVDVDRENNFIWVSEMMADQLGRFDPRTKTWIEYQLPTRNSSVRTIAVDPSRPSRVWYGGYYSDKLGYVDSGK